MDDTFDLREYLEIRHPQVEVLCKKHLKGEYIYRPPFDTQHIYQITEGVVKIGSYDDKGNRIIYDVLIPGDMFGNLGFLNREFNEFSKAITHINLNVINVSSFRKVLDEDTKLSNWFQKYIVGRWCKSESRLFSIASQDVVNRVIFLFRELKPHYEKFDLNFESLLKHQDIANLVGATRQTVSKAMKKIKKEDIDFFNASGDIKPINRLQKIAECA
ncbi:MAG: Crp/Fnr family transcriptional regulator [Bacteroidota bacterium]